MLKWIARCFLILVTVVVAHGPKLGSGIDFSPKEDPLAEVIRDEPSNSSATNH